MNYTNGQHFYLSPVSFGRPAVWGFSSMQLPLFSKRRPDEVKCPVCQDRSDPGFKFYISFGVNGESMLPGEMQWKEDCESCMGKGLHPIPMTELYDVELD